MRVAEGHGRDSDERDVAYALVQHDYAFEGISKEDIGGTISINC